MASFRLTPDAIDDLDAIWSFIFKDNPDAVEEEVRSAGAMLAETAAAWTSASGPDQPYPVCFWTDSSR